MHNFTEKSGSSSNGVIVIVVFLVAILLGIFSGYLLASSKHPHATVAKVNSKGQIETIKSGQVVGSNDTSSFKDSAEGELAEGGIGDEGQYHLVRSGGDSQNVYLTSSSVDLSQFVKHKIKVWGATQKAQKAGWLMDVGRVEVEN